MATKEGTNSTCIRCGAVFYRPPSNRGAFCSKKCHYASRSEKESTLQDRFNKYVDKTGGEGACWPWTASLMKTGYGCIREKGKTLKASRLAFQFANNVSLTPEQHVCHTCDNPACCNPAHLFIGNAKINADDKIAKGRHPFGEKDVKSKLTAHEVRLIRASVSKGVEQRLIAKALGVSEGTVSMVVNGKRWSHIS